MLCKLFHKTFRNLQSFLSKGCPKSPKTPIYKIKSKLPLLDTCHKNFTKIRDSNQTVADINGRKNLTEEKNAAPERKQEALRSSDMDTLAEKMEVLEKIEVNDEEQVLDLREVLHCYSHLTVPVYVEMVKKVLMDMHKELHILHASKSVNDDARLSQCSQFSEGDARII